MGAFPYILIQRFLVCGLLVCELDVCPVRVFTTQYHIILSGFAIRYPMPCPRGIYLTVLHLLRLVPTVCTVEKSHPAGRDGYQGSEFKWTGAEALGHHRGKRPLAPARPTRVGRPRNSCKSRRKRPGKTPIRHRRGGV